MFKWKREKREKESKEMIEKIDNKEVFPMSFTSFRIGKEEDKQSKYEGQVFINKTPDGKSITVDLQCKKTINLQCSKPIILEIGEFVFFTIEQEINFYWYGYVSSFNEDDIYIQATLEITKMVK